jgi:hypothetical protein
MANKITLLPYNLEHAVNLAISRRLPTAEARFIPRSVHVRFIMNILAMGQGFLQVLHFPLTIVIVLNVPYSSTSNMGARTVDKLVADVPSGLSLTPPPRN